MNGYCNVSRYRRCLSFQAYLGALFRGLYDDRKQVSESGANVADLHGVEAFEEQDNLWVKVATWQ